MNENRNFNEDFEIEQAGPEDVGCDLFEYELTPEGTYVPKIAYTSDPEEEKLLKKPIRRWGRAWIKWMQNTQQTLTFSCANAVGRSFREK